MQQLVQVCCVQAGQQQLFLPPLAPGWVQEEGLLGADQALPPVDIHIVGGGTGHRVHHGCEGGGSRVLLVGG